MGLEFHSTPGQTNLDDDEKEGLKISSIATRAELDEFEQQNIESAVEWVLKQKSIKTSVAFTEGFIKNLHKRMYGTVWRWAGEFRKSSKNIGFDPWQISSALKNLNDDAIFWVEKETFGPDEIAIRYKHRLVSIHCFPNGNGRHSRLMADIIVNKIFRLPVFSWGMLNQEPTDDPRDIYLKAIRKADKNDFAPLLAFARS